MREPTEFFEVPIMVPLAIENGYPGERHKDIGSSRDGGNKVQS
jgi:hypothetical protein